ncbi:hypothetical protein [Actinomadura rudentiformis]|uniref:STAS domain-containing protein n=1 Tax=Actinomadura rudentiformis TaxID=359158 RepID=A0A6H9YPR2_9ACTN|nr:hypothetical protein [Actinomadura rudentiformis]KAB2349713.1 hypothetical protein F8566_13260 [Actinomadura rudentiformis]
MLVLRGELDMATVPVLHPHLDDTLHAAAQQAAPPRIALNPLLCDSSGLNLPIRAWKQITAKGADGSC